MDNQDQPAPTRRSILVAIAALPTVMRNPAAASEHDPTNPGASGIHSAAMTGGDPGGAVGGHIDDQGIVVRSRDGRIAEALAEARARAISERREIVIPSGLYTASETIELSSTDLRVRGLGRVFIQSSASPILSIDAGVDSIECGHLLENIVLIGNGSPRQVGLYVRNSIQAVRRNIWVRNVRGAGIVVEGDVLTLWENCRVNHAGVPDTHQPAKAWHIRGSRYLGGTAACTFLNCIAEIGTEHGWYLEDTHDCVWLGGTSEAIAGVGVELARSTSGNGFINMFCEANAGGDVVADGKSHRFINCTMTSRAPVSPYEDVKSLIVKGTAVGVTVDGGDSFYAIEIERNAANTTLRNFECVRLFDGGAGTVTQDFRVLYDSATRHPGQTLGNVESHHPFVLDWYEQGSVPASLGGSSRGGPAIQAGTTTYTRIGNRVFFETTVQVTRASVRPTGELRFRTGLPWNAASDYAPSLGVFQGLSLPARAQIWLEGVGGATEVRMWAAAPENRAPALLTAENLAAGVPLRLTFSGAFCVANT